MRPIEGKLYAPFQKSESKYVYEDGKHFFKNELVWKKKDATVNRVRASDGFRVKSFRQLIEEVAMVTLQNKQYEMFYRGQTKDYKNNQAKYYKDRIPKSIIFPSICRPGLRKNGKPKYSIKAIEVQKRYKDLFAFVALFEKRKSNYDEYYYSLIQHYEILPTPLIDITQSLRVAATFALRESSTGYVYVFGLPYPNQSISYFTDLEIVLIKLQNVIHPDALRPRFQEGYLVGKYPFLPTKTNGDDLANRMVAKFLVENRNGKFWDDYFKPMPEDVLYPPNDKVKIELSKLRNEFQKNKNSLA